MMNRDIDMKLHTEQIHYLPHGVPTWMSMPSSMTAACSYNLVTAFIIVEVNIEVDWRRLYVVLSSRNFNIGVQTIPHSHYVTLLLLVVGAFVLRPDIEALMKRLTPALRIAGDSSKW